jgi:hypothetical protein
MIFVTEEWHRLVLITVLTIFAISQTDRLQSTVIA